MAVWDSSAAAAEAEVSIACSCEWCCCWAALALLRAVVYATRAGLAIFATTNVDHAHAQNSAPLTEEGSGPGCPATRLVPTDRCLGPKWN